MIVSKSEIHAFFKRCQAEGLGGFQQVIVPRRSMVQPRDLFFTALNDKVEMVLESYRTVDPLRALFYFPRERILGGDVPELKRLVVGAKACDLRALQVLDKALINADFVDPCYAAWRRNTTIVTVDCAEIGASCHCNLVGGKPYAEEGFDLNLTALDVDYYHLLVGSAKGEELLALIQSAIKITKASPEEQRLVSENRQAAVRKLQIQNAGLERGENYERLKKADIRTWIEEAQTCCGCGGCTNICPTCYCIILNDETTGKEFIKDKSWDSCQVNGYARVAGGATPRPKMFERFRNRYLCKFVNMPANFGLLGCTGCGRCIDVCAGKIKFTEVIKNVMEAKQVQETEHV